MTEQERAAARAVIDAAKTIERAAQYGIDSHHAHQAYDRARVEQARARYCLAAGAA